MRRKLIVDVAALAASAVTGLVVQGWTGMFLWPLTLLGIFLVLGILGLVLDVVVSVCRVRTRTRRIEARLRLLPDEQLCELMRTPTHPDSQFAMIELMRRGVEARPTKEQVFSMLTSGNSNQCIDAMTILEVFYPELSIPEGASNIDPPEMWQPRVQAMRRMR